MRLGRVLTALFCIALVAGCEVTPEKIARWKETERGPRKLREAVGDDGVKPALRGQALAALVEIGMASDGLGELAKAPDATRQSIVHETLAPLAALLGKPGSPDPTTRAQRDAKDALFDLRKDASAADRAQIDDLLVSWTTADLVGRMSQGGNSSEKILVAIGPKAAPRLLSLLAANSPQMLTAASILGKLADDATRTKAAEELGAQLRRSPSAAQSEPLLQALGLVGGPRVTAILIEEAEKGRARDKALLALAQGHLDPHDRVALDGALKLAGDKKAPGEVREAAFGVLEKIGADAVPGLVKLMDDSDETVRWRAVEAALAAGKEKAVSPVLEGLSPARPYKKDDLDSYVVHDLSMIGAAAVRPLEDELKSKSWVARVVAVRGLAAVGRAGDASALQPLTSDATPLKGWSGTVGTEAKGALAALRAKR